MMPDPPLSIDEVVSGPVAVPERPPDLEVIVDRDWVSDPEVPDRTFHVMDSLFERELRSMHANHDQALILVLLGPGPHVGNRADAVDAGVRPEVDEDDLATELFGCQRLRIQPLHGTIQGRQRALDWQAAVVVLANIVC